MRAGMAAILLVEDTPTLRLIYETMLRGQAKAILSAGSAAEAMAIFRRERPAVVVLDLMLPDGNGFDLMAEMLALAPEVRVIVITANGSVARAVEAVRAGAHDFLVKPVDETRLLTAVETACGSGGGRTFPAGARGGLPPGAFIGASPPMQEVYARIRSVARSMASVFVTGESGTGKELCAQAIHDLSPRADGPFVPLNCAAIPAERMESEVFGHLRGAFPGAMSDKAGAAIAADGGTLFLDEVCEMAPALQGKLLRFLQTLQVQPLGAARPRKVNLRIICATNRDPREAVRRGWLREDLYYRLHVVPIHLPPLRVRGDDVLRIAETALARFAREEGRALRAFSPEAAAVLLGCDWPGNVRQLLNVLRSVVVMHDGPVVSAEMLPPELIRGQCGGGAGAMPAPPDFAAPGPEPFLPDDARATALPRVWVGRTLAEIERLAIEDALARHGGSVPRAARELDVAPSTLYRKRDAWKKGRG
ncbi:sigma-54-dependent transcriptional regulator [Phaeovulum vinaykumarii]|nr:sigma-54 dependent transcriptional regulator [Phaeovulum vinaykumarii]